MRKKNKNTKQINRQTNKVILLKIYMNITNYVLSYYII